MEKKKILIFSLAYHPFIGGAEVAIKEITDRLGDDFSFEMITANLDGKQPSQEKIGNVLVHRLGKGKLSKYFFPWTALKKAKESGKYDLVWAMMANQAGWAALKYKKSFPSVKYLLTLQEGDSEWDIWLRTFFIQPIYKSIYRRADHIQAISGFLAERARKMGAKCEVEIIGNGAGFNNPQNIQEKTDLSLKNPKQILTVSRLVKKNGLEYLIKAMAFLPEDCKLVIVGGGPLRKKLENLAKKLKLEGRVKFEGENNHDWLFSAYQLSGVFVRPSLSEGLGNVFLEAMHFNLPVIATPVGGIPDFLKNGETGWFCRVKDPEDIARKIRYVLDERNKEEVMRVAANAGKMAREKYNWQSISQKIKNIFQTS